ncbi:oxygenase MpaB family protein [Rhodococcus sp. IEGM 1381]|uniref:oxygenase MpaB family protein n=1 Tax=Rhodococcus sp. IEGM 1381 TaxID=3047085 RepID=UPI0024B808D5|nr:oxygenase MpaB family protein [Rhodococcus sp. IEGM 1381]MDI9894508.1 oxygenase MpaB family protein [Rhodococcus sp. IEGM 1381]
MVRLRPGFTVGRTIRALDEVRDADEIARCSLVVLHGNPVLTYALFTVAFIEQVAIPTMARTLYRRDTGDIMVFPARRNADTIVFFGQLLDHGPTSTVGRAWIERLNQIHSHFPLRNDDSLYTLSTLALDPHQMTTAVGRSPFTSAQLEAQWHFWRAVAQEQKIANIPVSRELMQRWRVEYEEREFATSFEGRQVARSLIDDFARSALPVPLRRYATQIISAICPPRVREVHELPEPRRAIRWALRALVVGYSLSTPLRLVDLDRSFVRQFGGEWIDPSDPETVGYQKNREHGHRPGT